MSDRTEKHIGLLIGREWSWPSAIITEINDRQTEVTADFIHIGQTLLESPCPFDVIIDRMSHEIPYYRTYLKYAALNGCYIINNPFVTSSDDKFFGVALARRFGVETPRTVALPNKRVETENVPESFRNLVYPMDWQGIIDHVGVPAILKDINTGGRRVAKRVYNVDDLIRWYDESDTLTVVLQSVIESDLHLHALVIGGDRVMTLAYSMAEGRYIDAPTPIDPSVKERIETVASVLTKSFGYDINLVEFVVQDDRPYLINATNPTPDLDINLLTSEPFRWSVQSVADFALALARKGHQQFAAYGWHRLASRPDGEA